MRKITLMLVVIMGCAAATVCAEKKDAEIRLRDIDLSGLAVNKDQLTLTATFDVKGARVFDEVVFDFYLLLRPQGTDTQLQFLHCRTVHRYLDRKSGLKSGVKLDAAASDCIDPRDEKYAVVVSYKGKEVGVENSESERWWEDAALGAPVENILRRFASVPIVREWESAR